MNEPAYNILFLCTGNSARSILAEAVTNHRYGARFRAHSAGSHPTGRVNPHALQLLQRLGVDTEGLRSKSWDEFAAAGAPPLHFVFTVCDNAAGEVCPVWPGQPMTAHWGLPDPAASEGSESDRDRAFADALHVLERRISLFANLPLGTLDRLALKHQLQDIGRS
jgi:arsenate reductase